MESDHHIIRYNLKISYNLKMFKIFFQIFLVICKHKCTDGSLYKCKYIGGYFFSGKCIGQCFLH